MRLLCNGVALDLLSGAALSFKKSNPLFAFDSLTCERTQSFNIPATEHNERVMKLAKIPAYSGEGMRRRFDAELQDGTVVKQGYLYVDKYEKGKYSAVFVTGNLLELLAIKNAGKIADFWHPTDSVYYSGSGRVDMQNAAPFDSVGYIQKGDYGVIPSMSVAYIIREALEQLGVRYAMPEGADAIRLIPPKPMSIKNHVAHIKSEYDGSVNINTIDTMALLPIEFVSMERSANQVWQRDYYDATQQSGEPFLMSENNRQGNLRQFVACFKAFANLKITMPNDLPSDVYIVSLGSADFGGDMQFLGDYSFVKSPNYDRSTGFSIERYGEPLAGRTVEIARNTTFILISENDFYNQNTWEDVTIGSFSGLARIYAHGFDFRDSDRLYLNYDFEVQVAGANEVASIGEYVRLVDNLPDVTLTDLLKALAAMTGSVLNYTPEDGITFDDVSLQGWQTITLRDAIAMDSVDRKFGDYAQRNIVRYDSADDVPEAQRIEVVYTIDNENIAEENELQVLPFSEGDRGSIDGREVVSVGAENDKHTASSINIAGSYMTRVRLIKNAGVQALCDASTNISVRARMTLAEYEALGAKVALLYRNTRYVWTEATWSKGVATLKLSKIL